MSAYKKTGVFVIVIFVAGILILFFVLFGPPKLLAKSDTPGFCVSCHVMEAEYEAWMHAGAHRKAGCVDCHLPNQNTAAHYIWKAVDSFKDVIVFYSGRIPEQILLSLRGKKILQENCIRCHDVAVTMIDKERNCWECHRRVTHKLTGTIETL
jgi:cytochrome c nitrite reductase small subunit